MVNRLANAMKKHEVRDSFRRGASRSLTLGLGALVLHVPGRRNGWGGAVPDLIAVGVGTVGPLENHGEMAFYFLGPQLPRPFRRTFVATVFEPYLLSFLSSAIVVAKHMHRPWGQFLVLPPTHPPTKHTNTKEPKEYSFWYSSLFHSLLQHFDNIYIASKVST